jgi:competence protein ComEC
MAALAYAALAGFAISTQRALLMLMVVMLALLAGRTLRPASALLLALLAVLLLHPSSLLSYGFWLSFGAVAVLLYALGRRLAPARALWRWGRAQWAIALGLLPLLLMLFGRASLIAPAVNLVAVPLFGVILPLVLIAATATLLFSWNWPLALVGLLLDQCYALLASIATLPAASMTLGGRAHWVWIAALCGVLLLLAPRGLPARWLGLVLLLPLVLMRPAAPAPGEARFTLLDVGQGLAAVVRTHAHTLVYDLGPRYPSGFETGSAVVAPYLREIGVKRVDLVVASHADQDHVGGLRGLLGAMQVSKVVSGEPDELVDDLDGLDLAGCRRGQRWRWDGVDFELLHPAHDGYQGNDASCLLRVGSATAVLLLPGDLEQGVERRLAARLGQRLKADILVAGHHGSATSTSSEFLAAVQPTWVLYTSGYANRWGFPVAEVRERVNALGLASANTATDGAVSFVLPATGALAAPQRQRRNDRRIWRHRLDAP